VTTRLRDWFKENWLLVTIVAAIAAGYILLAQHPSNIGTSDQFLASLKQGEPTVISFYSNF